MNNISRTAPIALIVGVAGEIGANLAKKLLEKNIQVIGVDNFSASSKEFLEIFVRNKLFHLVEKGVEEIKNDDLPEVDYAYFLINEDISHEEYEKAFTNFLKLVSKKTRITLVSSLDLYNQNIGTHQNLKWAENFLVKQTKEDKLNARIVRITDVYGPGMDLSIDEPLFKLINLILSGDLSTHPISIDILTRAIFIDDVVNLLIKVIFHGSTANKIYDGSLLNPVKLNEVRQALLDPVWYEKTGFNPTKTTAWPTPNLIKTQNELNWQANTPILQGLRETVGFFNKYPQFKSKKKDKGKEVTPQVFQPVTRLQKLNLTPPQIQPIMPPPIKQIKSIKHNDFWEDQPKVSEKIKSSPQPAKPKILPKIKRFLTLIICLGIIGFGLVYPFTNILLAVFSLKEDLNQASQLALVGNLTEAGGFVKSGSEKLTWLTQVYDDLLLLRPEGVFNKEFATMDDLKLILTSAVRGTDNFLTGINALDQALNIVKGESVGDLNMNFTLSHAKLADSKRDFELIWALLNNQTFMNNQPELLKPKLNQLKEQSLKYADQAGQLDQISLLAADILPVNQTKNYLVVLEDNRTLDPSGGVVISALEIKVNNGKIINLVSNKSTDIDSKLGVGLSAPSEIQDSLGKEGLTLGNVTEIPDFIEFSKWLDLIYEKGTGDKIDGLVIIDLDGVKDVLDQSGDLKLGGNINVNSSNLDQLISQDQGSIKQDILKELVNKIIFVKNPNWNNLIASITKGVTGKHIATYISDPAILNLTSDFNWTPSLDYTPSDQTGDREEYLYFYESNKNVISNFSKNASLKSMISAAGEVSHNLTLEYKYNSGQKDLAKFKLTFNLPRGTKVNSAKWGDKDILKQETLLTKQNITSYSFGLDIGDKETKQLDLNYQDLLPIKFDNNGNLKYNQTIIKQLGEQDIPINFSLSYPSAYNINDKEELTVSGNMATTQNALSKDQNYQVIFSNK